jgi:acyl-CoA synthetase (AMP-forming)/AMP-acid ligase II
MPVENRQPMTVSEKGFRHEFARLSEKYNEAPALLDAKSGTVWTYADLASLTDRAAAYLAANGASKGKTVVTLLPNSVDTLVLFLGALRVGANFAPLSPQARAREIRNWIELVDPVLCLHTPSTHDVVASAGAPPSLRELTIETGGRLEWLGTQSEGATPAAPRDPSRLYIYTSGTTGEPKALVFDCDRLWAAACAFAMHHDILDSDCRFFSILPMSYLGGLFNLGMIPLSLGGSVVIAEAFSGRSYLHFWRNVERFKINVLWLAPTIVRGLLRLAGRGASPDAGQRKKIRLCFLGMAPADLLLKKQFEDTFEIPLLENFALSETIFITSETLQSRTRRSNGSVGEVLPFVQLRCASNDSEHEDPPPGEIEVKTPYMFLGYLKGDGRIECPKTEDGYFATGDLGRLTREGTLHYEGRTRDIVKKGGYMIVLREIEVLAEQHPLIEEASAVPIAHDFFGEDYVLAVRVRSTVDGLDPITELRTWLRSELAQFKWPGDIVECAEFPQTGTGKIKKQDLAERIQKERLARTASEVQS